MLRKISIDSSRLEYCVRLALLSAAFASQGCLAAPQAQQSASLAKEAPCAKPDALDYSDRATAAAHLQALYQAERFGELDEALSCLMQATQRFRSGHPASSAVYLFFKRQMPAPGAKPVEASTIRKWHEQRPESMFAEFADIRLKYALAWSARGGTAAVKVSDDGWKDFAQGLHDAEVAALGARQSLRETPILQNLLLATVVEQKQPSTSAQKVFDEGVKRWPAYYDFYDVKLSRLVPRWGGSWEQVDAFVEEWATRSRATEGDTMYARLYLSVLIGRVRPGETMLQWPRMKRSLDELVARYPGAVDGNVVASLGCSYADTEYFKAALRKLEASQTTPSGWLAGTDPATCKAKLLASDAALPAN